MCAQVGVALWASKTAIRTAWARFRSQPHISSAGGMGDMGEQLDALVRVVGTCDYVGMGCKKCPKISINAERKYYWVYLVPIPLLPIP